MPIKVAEKPFSDSCIKYGREHCNILLYHVMSCKHRRKETPIRVSCSERGTPGDNEQSTPGLGPTRKTKKIRKQQKCKIPNYNLLNVKSEKL